MVRPMVHSTKHYVQPGLRTVVAGAVEAHVIAEAVQVVDKNIASEVEEGTSIKAIYVEHWARAGSTSPGSFIYAIYKSPGAGATFSVAQMAAMSSSENKKNVLFFSQALINDQDADAIAIHRGWQKVPKSKQRMGLGDRWLTAHSAVGVDSIVCGFETYKEYT